MVVVVILAEVVVVGFPPCDVVVVGIAFEVVVGLLPELEKRWTASKIWDGRVSMRFGW